MTQTTKEIIKVMRVPHQGVNLFSFPVDRMDDFLVKLDFLPGLFREDLYFVPGPPLKGDHDALYFLRCIWSFCLVRVSASEIVSEELTWQLHVVCIIDRTYASFQVDIILFTFFKKLFYFIYLVPWRYHGWHGDGGCNKTFFGFRVLRVQEWEQQSWPKPKEL